MLPSIYRVGRKKLMARKKLIVVVVLCFVSTGVHVQEQAIACREPFGCDFGNSIDDRLMTEARERAADAEAEYNRQRAELQDEISREVLELQRREDAKKPPKLPEPTEPKKSSLPYCADHPYIKKCVPNCAGNPSGQQACVVRCLENLVADGVDCRL